MPASNTIVLKSLSILLGLFFIFVGTLKLTPHISKDLYKDLVSWKNRWHSLAGTKHCLPCGMLTLSSIFSQREKERNPQKYIATTRNKFIRVIVLHPSYITGSLRDFKRKHKRRYDGNGDILQSFIFEKFRIHAIYNDYDMTLPHWTRPQQCQSAAFTREML